MQEILRREIEIQGVISFARFMDLALYQPDCGYYEREKQAVGRRGDFYTSVSVGSLFGELLAFQFLDWVQDMPGEAFQLVEAGAHDGRLAVDMLSWIRQNRPKISQKLHYWIVEPSGRRQQWQQERLEEFAGQVRWVGDFSMLPAPGVTGVIFANELLDAMPVHRLGWDAKEQHWFEWGVKLSADKLAWERMPKSVGDSLTLCRDAGFNLPGDLGSFLPDGFTIEVSPKAGQWWSDAASSLQRGSLVAIDYGLAAEEFLGPHRARGTARAYVRHRWNDDLLASPGEQDLTAHVNFTHLQRIGEASGLTTDEFVSQERFLAHVAQRAMSPDALFSEWTTQRVRQFQTLTHPEHLGRSFKVLVQSRQPNAACNS